MTMKLSEQMKREFEAAVAIRVQEMLLEQVEAVAADQVKAILNGHGKTHKKAAHPIQYPASTVLKRGSKDGLKHFRMTQQSGLMANAAWEALARDGHFASKATRADMTAYLMKSFEGTTSSQVSATISQCIKRGVLVAGG
jgi:hypothetical protein